MKNILRIIGVSALFLSLVHCSSSNDDPSGNPDPVDPDPDPITSDVSFWLTKEDESVKLAKQNIALDFGNSSNSVQDIVVNASLPYQTVDGFGYTLTGGSATVINTLTTTTKQQLLQELFGADGIAVSYLRLSIGASDMSAAPFTYDDMPTGQTDPDLSEFSLSPDSSLIALVKEILAINPNIQIVATPWSAPLWMKDENTFVGGGLLPEYYEVYADYFVKYIEAMAAEGITIHAVTPQNEPLHDGNNPSMYMSSAEQNTFIKNNLGPAFQNSGITTKIIIYDHNCDNTAYPLDILGDPVTNTFVDGSAFHLYAGNISALSTVHNAFPEKNVYFTEQFTGSTGSFGGDLKWHLKNVIIGSMRNWSKNALEWNLATDASFGPHTDGGCSTCKGAITVNNATSYSKNVSYYIIAHASKFVPPGSVRIESTTTSSVNTVAFKTPTGKIVLIAENDTANPASFNIKYNGQWTTTNLAGGSVGTYVWDN